MTTEAVTKSLDRSPPWALIAVAIFLGVVGFGVIGTLSHGILTGWLSPYWTKLTDNQVSLVSTLVTIYAAAFAATLAPLIFHGQLTNLERASDAAIKELKTQFADLAKEQEASSRRVLEIAEQSQASLVLLQNYALHMMGFVDRFTEADLPNSRHILLGFQESAAILCQNALANSRRWETTRAQFDGMWPGYQPYIAKLSDLRIITDNQKVKLLEIADSRRYTRAHNPEAVDLVKLNLLNKTMKELQEELGSGGRN